MDAEVQFQANLAFLAHHPTHAQMYQQLHAFPLTNIKLVPLPNGQLAGEVWDIATQQWVMVCHPEDPRAHAEAMADQFYTPQARVFCLLGLGLGYHAVAFAKRLKPYQRLCIWDCEGTLFKAAMYAVDIAPLFTVPNVNVLVGSDVIHQVEPWWMQLHAPEKLLIQMPMREGYTNIYRKDEYEAVMTKTVDMLRFHAVGLATWRLFGREIGNNDLRNLPEYVAHPGYEHLEGLWKDKPAVCLAAGPSLEKNLVQLLAPAVRSRLAVIAAGTVYALAEALGLAPEVISTIDFQSLNWTDQFRYVSLNPACALVYLNSTYPQTVRRWAGPRFVAENSSDTMGWLRRYTGGKASAAEVQTVAHLNVKVALMLGANPIILLGQDLSMPRDTHHAAGARAQDQAPDEVAPDAFIEMPDYQGHPVHTRHSFLSMLTVFERLVASHPETTFYNCSEGGLAIQGAQHLPLAEVLATLHDAPVPAPLRPQIAQRFHAYRPQMDVSLLVDLAQLRQHTQELRDIAGRMEALEEQRIRLDETALTPEGRQALVSAETHTVLEEVEDRQALVDRDILAYEGQILGERAMAWAMFAIRRFDFIELMSEVPPPPDAVATPQAQGRYNAARLLRIAAMIREEAPEVARLLREAFLRLDTQVRMREALGLQEALMACGPILEIDAQTLHQLLSGQHYGLAQQALGHPMLVKELAPARYARFLAQYLRHTQQYAAANAVLTVWGHGPRHVQRGQRHLAQYHEDVGLALPKYFASKAVLAEEQRAPGMSGYY